MWIIAVAGGFLTAAIYAAVLYCQAKSHIGTAPKKDMFICRVHGALPLETTTNINADGYEYTLESGEVVRDQVPFCSICLEDRIKAAKKSQ